MERKSGAPPRAVYDAFLGMYGEDRMLSAVEPPHRLAYSRLERSMGHANPR